MLFELGSERVNINMITLSGEKCLPVIHHNVWKEFHASQHADLSDRRKLARTMGGLPKDVFIGYNGVWRQPIASASVYEDRIHLASIMIA